MHRLVLVSLACVVAVSGCGPEGPTGADRAGAPGGGGGSDGGPPAGNDAPGGATSPSGGGAPPGGTTPAGGTAQGGGSSDGGRTLWSMKMGGKGVEWSEGVAATPGGEAVSFNIVGVRGETLEQIALVRVGSDGRELATRLFDAAGAAFRFSAAGALAVAPAGDVVVAFTTTCKNCPAFAGTPASGATLVSFSAEGDPRWARTLPGEIATNPAVGPGGDIVIGAVSQRGAVLRRYLADGTQRWELTQAGIGAGSPVAIDASGDVLYATGNAVVKLDRDGQQLWKVRVDGDDVVATAIAAVGDDAVLRGRAKSGPFLAALSSSGAVRWVHALPGEAAAGASLLASDGDGRSVVVMGADGCGASVAAFDAGGAPRWSRPLARAGCDGGQLGVHGVAVTPQGRILTGGALSAAADFGAGPLNVQATDAFLVALTP